MNVRNLVSIASILLFLCSFICAQTQPSDDAADKAKKQKQIDEKVVAILDQAIAEANSLRLPANRAVVYSMTGDLYWKFDSKRSRELFRNAATEIVTYNQEYEKEKRESTDINFDAYDSNDVRLEVLSLMANHDAELALELLLQTRSAAVSDAMAKASMVDVKAAATGDTGFNFGRQLASQEIGMEQRFTMLAAMSDPEKAAKAIKDSLAKGISFNVIALLQVVFKKDEKKAADLSGDVIAKIVDTDLTKNNDDLNGAIGFLQFFVRSPPNPNPAANAAPKVKVFSFSDTQAKDVANKLATTFLQPGTSPAISSALSRSLSSLEKLVPEKILLLKQREAQNKKSQPNNNGNSQILAKFYEQNTTPEEVLTQAAKLPNERDKMMVYQAVSARISQITDDARAKKLIEQIPDDKIRTTASEQYESVRIGRLTGADKLDEARKSIGALTNKKIKIQKLVSLAAQLQKKAGEGDVDTARSLMVDARALTNPYPEDEDDLADLMEVVRGYATVEPDTAFRMFEPVVDQFNEMVQATAILSKYNKRDRSFKKGEMLMRVNGNFGGGLLLFRYIPLLQILGKADIERMSMLADRFSRTDSRTLIKLYVLQGFLRSDGQQIRF